MSGSIIRQDASYRKGLVLGLTMAEIVILIIFCLLLILSLMLLSKEKQEKQVEERDRIITRKTRENTRLQERIKYLSAGISNQGKFDDLFRDLEITRQRADELEHLRNQNTELKERVKFLEDKTTLLSSNLTEREKIKKLLQELEMEKKTSKETESLSKQVKELKERTRALDDLGNTISKNKSDKDNPAEKIEDILNQLDLAEDISRVLEEHGLPTGNPKDLREALGKSALGPKLAIENQQLKRENENLKGQVKNMVQKFAGLGKGTEHPACWADPVTGKPEYIFDVLLTTKGLNVRDRKLPHRAEEQATLPIGTISFDQEVSPTRFRAETLPILEWSKKNDCRFFVRAFDLTKEYEKKIYKNHIRILEETFYKYESMSQSLEQE